MAATATSTGLRARLEEAGARPVTFALYDAYGEAPDSEGAPFGALDTVWHLDPDLAARTLQSAIKEKTAFDAEKKDLIYALGGVLEKMGKAEEAIEQYKLIYEVDIGYKDVSAKVDKYYSGQ